MLLGVTANSPHCLHESIRRNQTLKDACFVAQNILFFYVPRSSEQSTQKEYEILVF